MTVPDQFAIGSPDWPGLGKLMEEAGEVIQIGGKLLGTGGEIAHWDGSNLRERIMEELGDLRAAIQFFMEQNMTKAEMDHVRRRSLNKQGIFLGWHEDPENTP